MYNTNKRHRGFLQKEIYFLLYILDQYDRIMGRGEPVTGIGKTFEDQLIKYQ